MQFLSLNPNLQEFLRWSSLDSVDIGSWSFPWMSHFIGLSLLSALLLLAVGCYDWLLQTETHNITTVMHYCTMLCEMSRQSKKALETSDCQCFDFNFKRDRSQWCQAKALKTLSVCLEHFKCLSGAFQLCVLSISSVLLKHFKGPFGVFQASIWSILSIHLEHFERLSDVFQASIWSILSVCLDLEHFKHPSWVFEVSI